MNLKAFLSLLFLSLVFFNPNPVLAKKKLPPRKVKGVSTSLPWIKLKLRSDHNALLLMLGNMPEAEAVDYLLTYTADSVPQGIQSYHTPEHGNTQKELIFGTCSNTDCTYHQDITDMLFEITVSYKDGKTLTRKYQINP